MGCSFKTDKSIVREKFTLLLYVVYVVVCFSLSDNIYLINNSKFYCRISALPAQQGGETGSRGPWGFFAEYWIFEVWLPWTIVIKPIMWWSKLFSKSNNADHQDHRNHPPVRGAAGEGTMAGIWPLPAFTCFALQIFVYLDQLNHQCYQSSFINDQSPISSIINIMNHQSSIINHQSSIINHQYHHQYHQYHHNHHQSSSSSSSSSSIIIIIIIIIIINHQ